MSTRPSSTVGAGVAKEILEALVHGKKVYSLALRDYDSAWSLSGHKPQMPGTILTIEQTRARRAEKLAELSAA